VGGRLQPTIKNVKTAWPRRKIVPSHRPDKWTAAASTLAPWRLRSLGRKWRIEAIYPTCLLVGRCWDLMHRGEQVETGFSAIHYQYRDDDLELDYSH
jgi:hypothetical protein